MATEEVSVERVKFQLPADTDERVVDTYDKLRRFKGAQSRSDWIDRRKEGWDAIENIFLDDAAKKEMSDQGQVPLISNKIVKGVQAKCAVVTDKQPEMIVHPIGTDDKYIADLFKRGLDLVWEKNEGDDEVYDVEEEKNVGGVSFFEAKFNKNKGIWGRIEFEESPSPDIHWDQDSRKRDFSDTDLIKAKIRTKNYVKERYDVVDEDLRYGQDVQDEGQKSSGIEGADNYAEGEPDTAKSDSKAIEAKIVWEIEHWHRKVKKEDWVLVDNSELVPLKPTEGNTSKEEAAAAQGGEYVKRAIDYVYHRVIVGKKLMSETENPYGTDADGDPVIGLIGLKAQRTRKSYAMAPTHYALDINREKIKRRAQFIYIVAQNANAPVVRTATGSKWTGKPGQPGSELLIDKNVGILPFRLQPGAMEAQLFGELENRADREIDEIFDIDDISKGRVPPGQERMAFRAVLALQDASATMSRPQTRRLESAEVRLAKVLVVLMLRHWTQPMWLRLIEKDELEGVDDNGESLKDADGELIRDKWLGAVERLRPADLSQEPDLSLMDLDIKITAGSSMPTNRMAKQWVALEMKREGVYDAQAVLEASDDPKADEILPRVKLMEQNAAIAAASKGKK